MRKTEFFIPKRKELIMKAMVIERFNEPMVLREVPKPSIGAGDILLRVRACGLCATDLKILDGDFDTIKPPIIPGHELAGEVAEIGEGVKGWNVGDHGVVHIYITCGNCFHCRIGRENNCTQRVGRIGFEVDGGFGEYVRIPAWNLFKISNDIALEQACILSGSVATPLHAIREQGKLRAGETVALIGIGGLGIHTLQLAVALGARVIAVDIMANKLEAAQNFGAADTIDSSKHDFVSKIRSLTNGEGADMIVEILGGKHLPQVIEESIYGLRPGGRLVLSGYQMGQKASFDPAKIVTDEIEIIGSRASIRQDLIDVISMTERGVIRPLISERYPLEQANKALAKLRKSASLGRMVLTL
jgi:propanol-preferring alcohol dehydrogenase